MKNRASEITHYEIPKKFKKYHKYLIAGTILSITSFLLTLVPCSIKSQKNIVYGLCKLPNPFVSLETTSHYYYNYTNNPVTGLIFQFLIGVMLLFCIIYVFKKFKIKKKEHRIIDYTKK
jgi:hypothetical protein